MTTLPLSLNISATNLPRDDRAFRGPVVHVSDPTVHSSYTTPAVPSLTPPTAEQQPWFAAPWSGRYKTVTKQSSHNYSGVVADSGQGSSVSGSSTNYAFPQPSCQP